MADIERAQSTIVSTTSVPEQNPVALQRLVDRCWYDRETLRGSLVELEHVLPEQVASRDRFRLAIAGLFGVATGMGAATTGLAASTIQGRNSTTNDALVVGGVITGIAAVIAAVATVLHGEGFGDPAYRNGTVSALESAQSFFESIDANLKVLSAAIQGTPLEDWELRYRRLAFSCTLR